jgi:hypothetical protein
MFSGPLLAVLLVCLVYFGHPYIGLGLIAGAAAVAGIGAGFYMRHLISRLTTGYAISDERLTFGEHIRNTARAHSYGELWLWMLGSLLFAAPGVSRLIHGHLEVPSIVVAVLFGWCFIIFLSMIVSKFRST